MKLAPSGSVSLLLQGGVLTQVVRSSHERVGDAVTTVATRRERFATDSSDFMVTGVAMIVGDLVNAGLRHGLSWLIAHNGDAPIQGCNTGDRG